MTPHRRPVLTAWAAGLAAAAFLSACGKDRVEAAFPNGKPKIIRTYGLFGGPARENLRRERTFYFNEHKESDSHWKNGKRDGLYVDYWHNGQKKSQGRYRAGRKEGVWEFYYNEFTLSSKGEFRDDRKEGVWKSFWENGAAKSEGAFSAGEETGTWKEWTAKGEPVSVNSCFPANDTGRFVSYHAGNTVKEEYACRKGAPRGAYVKRDPEGTVVERGAFDAQGRKQGVWETFYGEGRKASRKTFAAGLEQDSGYAWDEAGRLRERAWFEAGAGERLRYDSLGNLIQRTRYAKGVPDGEDWMYWPMPGPGPAATGPKRQCVIYADGKPVSLRKWHPDGRPMTEGAFTNGKRAGEWKEWWENGALKESARYQDGALHGERLFYDRNGRLMRTIRYEHGYPAEGRIPKAVAHGGIAGDSGAAPWPGPIRKAPATPP